MGKDIFRTLKNYNHGYYANASPDEIKVYDNKVKELKKRILADMENAPEIIAEEFAKHETKRYRAAFTKGQLPLIIANAEWKAVDNVMMSLTDSKPLNNMIKENNKDSIITDKVKDLSNNGLINSVEDFELIDVNGQKALFTNSRLKEGDIPQGLYKYELRGGNMYEFETIEKSVFVDYAGTILTKEPFDFGEKDYIELDDENSPNFFGEFLSMDEFVKTDYDLKEQTMEGM